MAWFSKLFIFTVLSVLLTNCQSMSDRAKDAFKTADESLEQSGGVNYFAVDGLYASIKQNRHKNEPLAIQAGKLFSSTKEAHAYLEDLKQRLKATDSSGVDINIPAQLFVGTATADTLSQKLLAVYDHSYAALVNKNKTHSLDSALLVFKDMRNKQWTENFFDKTPTIAAITILSKFQYDCLDAARICLYDVKQHLDN